MRVSYLIFLLLFCFTSGCNLSVEIQTQVAQGTTATAVTTPAPGLTSAASIAVTRTANPPTTTVTFAQSANVNQGGGCSPRADWSIYVVAAGDTLGSIAQRAGTTTSALSTANCLTDANLITVGQLLRVPVSIVQTTPIGPPTPSGILVGGQLTVSPVIGNDSGWLVLQAGSTVTITWPRAEQLGAVEVNFMLSAPGTSSTPSYIGTDSNTADGVSMQWTVPRTGAHGYLEATAGTLGGRVLVDRTQTPLQILAAPLDSGGDVQITSFTVSPNPVQRGGTLTLSWTTSGASSAMITRYSERGDPIDETWGRNIPLTGSMTYALPAQEYFNYASFVLTANPGQSNSVSQRMDIDLICPVTSALYVGCPMTSQMVSVIYQIFAGGHMYWRRDTRKIYVLINDGTWHIFDDTWVEGEPVYPSMPEDGSIPCPAMRPQRGLGKVWYTQSQPGIQPSLRDQLGCPTNAETSYDTPWEEHRGWKPDGTPSIINVFRTPGGARLILDPSSGWALPPN